VSVYVIWQKELSDDSVVQSHWHSQQFYEYLLLKGNFRLSFFPVIYSQSQIAMHCNCHLF